MNKLIKRIKDLNKRVLKSVHDKVEYLVGPLFVIGIVGLVSAGYLYLDSRNGAYLPKDTESFSNTSVKVLNMEGSSGGTGVILTSTAAITTILTNKHVCDVIKNGGVIEYKQRKIIIRDYQNYKYHDLCLVRVTENLNVQTRIAKTPPKQHSPAFISGHPSLLPHVVSPGSFSDRFIVKVRTGSRKCTAAEMNRMLECVLFGEVPVVESFNAQLVTGIVLPGSSGSAVFNLSGEIAGIVFASSGFAVAVPQESVLDFVSDIDESKYIPVSTNESGADSDKNSAKSPARRKEKRSSLYSPERDTACRPISDDVIWGR